MNHLTMELAMNGARLTGRVLAIEDVTRNEREQMFALMDRYYAGMRRDDFDVDLAEKQWVIQVVDGQSGAIRGFSTQRLMRVAWDGRTIAAIFSGDTIVDRDCWSGNPLAQLWGRFALTLIDTLPDEALYWFLISKGFRTYRFLPLFFHEFYPRAGVVTPGWAHELIGALGRARFPDAFDAAAGVVRAAMSPCRLRHGVGEVTPARLSDPDIRFFVERNPGHERGDELCCIAPLARANFTRAAYRTIGREWADALPQRS